MTSRHITIFIYRKFEEGNILEEIILFRFVITAFIGL